MAVQGTILGVALAFSPSPWYAIYASTATVWHISPIEDQQIAGLIMWIPAGAVYLAAAVALIGRAMAEPESVRERADLRPQRMLRPAAARPRLRP
jgi:putative membrane protein